MSSSMLFASQLKSVTIDASNLQHATLTIDDEVITLVHGAQGLKQFGEIVGYEVSIRHKSGSEYEITISCDSRSILEHSLVIHGEAQVKEVHPRSAVNTYDYDITPLKSASLHDFSPKKNSTDINSSTDLKCDREQRFYSSELLAFLPEDATMIVDTKSKASNELSNILVEINPQVLSDHPGVHNFLHQTRCTFVELEKQLHELDAQMEASLCELDVQEDEQFSSYTRIQDIIAERDNILREQEALMSARQELISFVKSSENVDGLQDFIEQLESQLV